MPSIRLTFSQAWFAGIKRAAEESGQTPEQLLQGLIALSIAPPATRRKRKGKGSPQLVRQPHEQALIDEVIELCRSLDGTRNQLVGALQSLACKPRRNARVQAERATSSSCLTAAIKRKGIIQRQVAKYLGVRDSTVSLVAHGRISMPPAWVAPLNELFGEDWLDERLGG